MAKLTRVEKNKNWKACSSGEFEIREGSLGAMLCSGCSEVINKCYICKKYFKYPCDVFCGDGKGQEHICGDCADYYLDMDQGF